MRRIFTGLMLTALMVSASGTVDAFAQTGKIAGRVTEASTGEPLPGVNVSITGTTQGTATNIDGEYVIIGVRPGTYTVQASFIGFATQIREGVRVNLDLTTTVNFEMTEQVLEGEEVVITAESVAVRKDITSSEARVSSETLERLPVTELGQVLDVQAGVTTRNGALHIRGGRSSEVVFMVDGVPVTDSYNGSVAVQLENDGIEELQVISGTFNAEFGNAMSGVINVVTKEGRSDRWGGAAQVYSGSYLVTGEGGEAYLRGVDTEEFTRAGIQYRDVDPYSYLDIDPNHYYNAQLSLEGPIVGDRLTFFGLGRYFTNDGWLYGTDKFDIDGTAGDSSLVPMNTFERFSYQSNLKFRLSSSLIFNLTGLGQFSESRPYDFFRRWAPDGRTNGFNTGYNLKLKMTHLISNRTFYTFNVATFYQENKSRLFDDPFDARYNDFNLSPPDSVEVRPGEYNPVLTGLRFARGGTDLSRFRRTTRSYLVKADLSSQLGRNHLVKTGFQVKVDNMDLRLFGLIPSVDENGNRIEPFEPAIPNDASSSITQFEDFSPLSISAYLQDKIEFDNFIVNAGLRLDYFDSRARIPADREDPNIFNPLKKINRFNDLDGDGIISADEEVSANRKTREERQTYWWKDVDAKVQLSPRLGVAYPITEQGVVHFSYGIFFQIPTINRLSDNFGFKIPSSSGSYGPFGNPDLDAQKTIMYEIGFKQGFGDFVVDLTGYYRDVRDWVSTSPPILTTLPGISYVVYTNRDYANTRGITASFSRSLTDLLGFDLSYTFQVVEGSNSNPADEFFATQSNQQPTLALLPLDWDQRHKIAGAFYTGGENWGGSLRFRWEDGFPYTPSFLQAAQFGNDVQPEFPRNSRRLPPAFEVDINLYKQFDMGRVKPKVFLEIFNVLDARNVTNVFSDTGEPDVTLQQLQTSNFDPGFWVRPSFYREPRRIQLGLEFRF